MIPDISYQGQVFYAYVSILIENEEEITIECCIYMLESRDASRWQSVSYNFRLICHHSFVILDKLTFTIH